VNTKAPQTADQALEARVLSEDELDDVNGAILPVLLAALAFEVGALGGVIAANYAYTGNFLGDID
jgi:hypothetical protein